MKRYTLTFTCEVTLNEDQIWPDGVPADATAQDVAAVVEDEGGALAVLRDWNLDGDMSVSIICLDDRTYAEVK